LSKSKLAADVQVVPRFDRVVEPQKEGIQAFARVELHVGVGLDGGDVIGARVVDAIDRAGLELEPALGGLIAPPELDVRRLRSLAPVAVEGVEDQAIALLPRTELVRPGAVGIVEVRLVGRVGLEVGRVLDAERAERDLREEGDVRGAHLELDGQVVDGRDLLEQAGVRLDATGRLAVGRIGDGLEWRFRRGRWTLGCRGRCHARRRRGACTGHDDRRGAEQRSQSARQARRTSHAQVLLLTSPEGRPSSSLGRHTWDKVRRRRTDPFRRRCAGTLAPACARC
jgi:hypothetical protein